MINKALLFLAFAVILVAVLSVMFNTESYKHDSLIKKEKETISSLAKPKNNHDEMVVDTVEYSIEPQASVENQEKNERVIAIESKTKEKAKLVVAQSNVQSKVMKTAEATQKEESDESHPEKSTTEEVVVHELNINDEIKALTQFGENYPERLRLMNDVYDLNEDEVYHVMDYLTSTANDYFSVTGAATSTEQENQNNEDLEAVESGQPTEALTQQDSIKVTSLEEELSSKETGLSEEELRKLQDNLAENSIRNDLLEVLLNIHPMPDGLGQMMLDIVNDDEQSPVWRDYVVQHYAVYVTNYLSEKDDLEDLEEFKESYLQLVNQNKSISATSLIGMNFLMNQEVMFEKDEVSEAAQTIYNKNDMMPGAKATAQNMLIELDVEMDFSKSKQEASSKSNSLATRFSAIYHLGFGGREELNHLNDLKADPDNQHLLPAIHRSLNQLNLNLGN